MINDKNIQQKFTAPVHLVFMEICSLHHSHPRVIAGHTRNRALCKSSRAQDSTGRAHHPQKYHMPSWNTSWNNVCCCHLYITVTCISTDSSNELCDVVRSRQLGRPLLLAFNGLTLGMTASTWKQCIIDYTVTTLLTFGSTDRLHVERQGAPSFAEEFSFQWICIILVSLYCNGFDSLISINYTVQCTHNCITVYK